MFRSRSMGVPAAVAAAVAVTFWPTAAAAQSRQMTFQLAGQHGNSLAVTVEYLDPSIVSEELGGSRALPVLLTVRNLSTQTMPFASDAVRLVLDGGETLRPLPPRAVVEDIRKFKKVPGILGFLGTQATTFNPGALESRLNARQLRDRVLGPNDSQKGLLYFLTPAGFQAATFTGALTLELEGHAPQMLATSKMGVETKAPEKPGYVARAKELYAKYFAATPPSFDKSYALLIGIGKYRHLGRLESPPRDLQKMKAYLEAQGFDEVVTLLDEQVTPEAFRQPQRYLKAKMKANDRFLFYYSGHGVTDGEGLATRGYVPLLDEKDDGRHARSIPMIDLVAWLKGLSVQHLFVVLDSCFAGLAIDGTELKGVTQPDPKVDMAALHRMSRGPARYLIMAGDKGQESFGGTQWDGSLFTHALLNGLRRDADLYKDHIVTARELYVWLKPAVEKEAGRAKRELTPMFKDLGPGGSSPGDFVFVQ
jgi:hypothetical protein